MADLDVVEGFERTRAENRVLNRLFSLVFSPSELGDVLAVTADLILEATFADACFVHLLDGHDGHLVLRAANEPFADVVGRVRLALGEGIAGWVAQNRTPVRITEDKWSDPRYKYIPELGGDRYTSMLSVPLISPAGRLVGVVNIHTEKRREFGDADVRFLQHVASLVAAAIEHAELFSELAAKETQLQGIIERTIQAQEEERRRVATEIHDGVTQHLVSIWYRMNACESLLLKDPARALEELAAAQSLIDAALDEARSAISDLRPSTLDDLGLAPALQALAAHARTDDLSVTVETNMSVPLPNHIETALYRIAQECLNNVRKHAGPCRVLIELDEVDGGLSMRVTDDGNGFDLDSHWASRPQTSFGLTGMNERAELIGGDLAVVSSPGQGTRVELNVPLDMEVVDAV